MAPKTTPNAPKPTKPKKITQAALGRHLDFSERSVPMDTRRGLAVRFRCQAITATPGITPWERITAQHQSIEYRDGSYQKILIVKGRYRA